MPTHADFLGFVPYIVFQPIPIRWEMLCITEGVTTFMMKISLVRLLWVVGDDSVLFQNFLFISVMSTYIGNS